MVANSERADGMLGRTMQRMHRRVAAAAALTLLLGSAACAPRTLAEGAQAGEAADAAMEPQAAFWANLRAHCGNAYRGRLTLEPPGDDMLTGTEELIVHFRSCGRDTLLLPFHIEVEATGEWDRSRTWMFMRAADALELRHDHRRPDGSADEQTMYGAFTQATGTATQQEFILTERTARDGSPLGWRIIIEPQRRYTYGTIRGGEWTWRVDFDLSQMVPAPPPPWGH
jgi:hypothetical protein